jgi:hypothetical protein
MNNDKPAIVRLSRRFATASLRKEAIGIWAPVTMTVFLAHLIQKDSTSRLEREDANPKSSNKKESALAVYARVSFGIRLD